MSNFNLTRRRNHYVPLGHVLLGGVKRMLDEYNASHSNSKRHKSHHHRTMNVLNSMDAHTVSFPVIENPNFSMSLENHASSERTDSEI